MERCGGAGGGGGFVTSIDERLQVTVRLRQMARLQHFSTTAGPLLTINLYANDCKLELDYRFFYSIMNMCRYLNAVEFIPSGVSE